jgi:DNA-binding transcriptional LysR family regulator
MLDAGLGISVIPTLAVPPEGLTQLAVRPLLPRVDREIVLVHRRNRALGPVAQAAWDLVRDVAAQRVGGAQHAVKGRNGRGG